MVIPNFNGQKVLVTGATGYLGAHVVSLLLQKGYFVRAAVRNHKKADLFAAKFASYKERLEFVFVDLSKPESFNGIMEGLSGIFHVGAPLPTAFKSSIKDDILDPAIEGNLALVRAAAKVPSIKRIVFTSSLAAIVNPVPDPNHVYSEKDWNPLTYESAMKLAGPQTALFAYAASKKLGEQAVFNFVEKEKPQFDVVMLLPSYITGPAEGPVESVSDISSLNYIYEYITSKKEVETVTPFHFIVDVRDVANAHILAFENPKASNQRYVLAAEPVSWSEVVDIAHKDFAGKTNAPPPAHPPLPQYIKLDISKSKQELGVTYRTKEESIRDSIANLLELRQQGKLA